VVLGLYDGAEGRRPEEAMVHRMAEMPLNHLGLILRAHDIRKGLPAVESLGDVGGVLCWFSGDRMAAPEKFVEWLERASAGRKLVWAGTAAFYRRSDGQVTPAAVRQRAWKLLGIENRGHWTELTYDAKVIVSDPQVIGFERKLTGVLPPFGIFHMAAEGWKAHLVLRRPSGEESTLVATGPRGGFVAPDYTHRVGPEHDWQWNIDPIEFFRRAFDLAGVPAPDTTTLSGRRIYYSHIDGDGWRNRTEVMPYRKDGKLSSEVVWRELIHPYPDLPVTVAPIAGDLDPKWRGSGEMLDLARRILAEPQVEAGTHTYTHPLKWEFYSKYDRSQEPLAPLTAAGEIINGPRAYADRPFDVNHEIGGSSEFINRLLPKGKKVQVVQWSGNTQAFEEVIAASRKAGLANINGGDSRYDAEYPSLIWVAPLGRRVGTQLQVYSSSSNENTYTSLWTNRFFGYRLVENTINRTEKPRRLKPFNLYYHMYTGEKHAALHALKHGLERARNSELAPVETSRFARIVEGFFSAELTLQADGAWRIGQRCQLPTLRFDHAAGRSVDWRRSRGVAGERHHQGSLYVALDESEPDAVVALRNGPPDPAVASLIESRWRIWDVQRLADGIRFRAQGYGKGSMAWQVPMRGGFIASVNGAEAARGRVGNDGVLRAELSVPAREPVQVEIRGGYR
jgi:hypothetical protein